MGRKSFYLFTFFSINFQKLKIWKEKEKDIFFHQNHASGLVFQKSEDKKQKQKQKRMYPQKSKLKPFSHLERYKIILLTQTG